MQNLQLKEILTKMSYDELVDSVMDYTKLDACFEQAFKTHIISKLRNGGEADARREVDTSFCLFRPSKNRYDGYYDNDWFGIMEASRELFEKARKAISFGNLGRAVAYPLQWLQCFSVEFTEDAFSYDDEGISFGCTCEEAMEIIEEVINHPLADAEFKENVSLELSVIAGNATVFDDHGFVNLKVFAQRIKAMTISGEEALSIIEELIERNEPGTSLSDLIIQKANILFSMKKENDAMRFLENNVREKDVCEYLLVILIGKKDYVEALNVLDKALKFGNFFDGRKWLIKKIEIYEILGDNNNIIESYRKIFIFTGGDFEYYEALKKYISLNEWKSFLSVLMKETHFDSFCFDGKNQKAEILIAENDFQGLFDYMCENADSYKLDLYAKYARRLPNDYQRNLIPYYMDAIRKEAETANKRSHYSNVRCHIVHFKKMNESEESVMTLLDELRNQYRGRSAFIDELKDV